MTKGIVRKIQKVSKKIYDEINAQTNHDSIYSAGLAYEGYQGGYLAALSDVLLALNGINPNRNRWWDDEE